MRIDLYLASIFLCLVTCVCDTNAVVITCQPVGADVVCSAPETSFDLTGLTAAGRGSLNGGLISPSTRDFRLGQFASVSTDFYTGWSGPATFGTGGIATADSGTVSSFGLTFSDQLYLPRDYVSLATIPASQSTYANADFATLGITPGTYTWSWGANANQRITLNAVPEASAVLCLSAVGLCVAGFATSRRLQRRSR